MAENSVKPMRGIEHIIHWLLILATGGIWVVVYIPRVLLKQREINKLSPEQRAQFKSNVKAKYSKKSSKESLMDAVNKINATLPPNQGIAEYQKKTFANEEEADEWDWQEFNEEFSFEAVGEKNYRQDILKIIRKNDALKDGELIVDAIMQSEPDNEFDEFAVAILIDGKKVGYVPSSISWDVTTFFDEHSVEGMKVRAKIAWDTNNPAPLIGVFLDFNF